MNIKEKCKVAVITNVCSHYRRNFFEKLSKACDATFLFLEDDLNTYWESKDKLNAGNFRREYLWGLWITKKIKITPSLIYKIAPGRYDVIIKGVSGRFALPAVFLLAKLYSIPFILWTGLWHHPETAFHKISFPFLRLIYRGSDALLVYGEHVKKYLLSLGVDEKKIFIANQAVNDSLFNKNLTDSEKNQIREKIGLVGQKVVLFVGRLEVYKGIYHLLDAFGDFACKNAKASLLIIGTGSQYEDFKKTVRNRKLDKVFLLGHVANELLYQYYSIADVLVLPSITTKTFKEPWGMVVNEAMNQGCPVIATSSVGAAAGGLIKNHINGLIVNEGSRESLAQALETLLSNDDILEKMRINSKEAVRQLTDESRVGAFIDAISFAVETKVKKGRKYN